MLCHTISESCQKYAEFHQKYLEVLFNWLVGILFVEIPKSDLPCMSRYHNERSVTELGKMVVCASRNIVFSRG